jgi:hypothetical protein
MMARQLIHHGAVRYYRHDEQFWRELIGRWQESGIGVRKFCEQNGVAASTFHKRRAELAKREVVAPSANVMTPDACFIAVLPDMAAAAPEQMAAAPLAPTAKQQTRDSVVISSGGMRIELTGAHADRVVRQLLGRLGGFTC